MHLNPVGLFLIYILMIKGNNVSLLEIKKFL